MKDFNAWNERKKLVEMKKNLVLFRERDIVFILMGVNVGVEQDGKGTKFLRPVLVVKKFSRNSFWGLALTSKYKKNKLYFKFFIKGKTSVVILSQLKLYDSKRIEYSYARLSDFIFKKIKKRLSKLLT